MGAKDILRLIPTLQSVDLVRKVSKTKKPIKSAVDTIFGTALIQAESQLINDF